MYLFVHTYYVHAWICINALTCVYMAFMQGSVQSLSIGFCVFHHHHQRPVFVWRKHTYTCTCTYMHSCVLVIICFGSATCIHTHTCTVAGIPVYFLSLGLGVLIKFYMSPVAAWISFSVTLCFMAVWWKFHSGQMTYLTHSKSVEIPGWSKLFDLFLFCGNSTVVKWRILHIVSL